jgi:hypothetical protein
MMIIDDLSKEFLLFASGKKTLSDLPNRSAKKTVWSKGPFFEVPELSYQRARMKQGKIINTPEKIKNYSDIYKYEFDEKNNIINIYIGNEFGEFSHDLFYWTHDKCKCYFFDEDKDIISLAEFLLEDGKINKSYLYGKYGYQEEHYDFDENRLIRVKTFGFNHNEKPTDYSKEYNEELFYYTNDKLSRIDLRYPTGDTETIWRP